MASDSLESATQVFHASNTPTVVEDVQYCIILMR